MIDKFNRVLIKEITRDGRDMYTITDNVSSFTITVNEGTADSIVLNTANGMAPASYQEPIIIPDVTKRQILLWMYQNLGKTNTDIETAIAAISDPQQSAIAMITWQYPDGPFQRSNPMFDELAPIFGMTSEQVDTAFMAASSL